MPISQKQAERLCVPSHSRWSPYLEQCCLLLSANESYQRAAEDIEVLTGLKVSHSTQQRLVQRHRFNSPEVSQTVEEMSVDGGKIRLRTPLGQASRWQDYKAINLHEQCVAAFFQENTDLVNWANQQALSRPVICLGDGHDGIWNIFEQIGDEAGRCEILDWYHLVENLAKTGDPKQRLDAAEACLWMGDVDGAIDLFRDGQHPQVLNFITYLNEHRHRIVNYSYYQAEGISIGSGAIESTVKQIGRRVKISGAQWAKENVPQVLRHRTAYLNGQLSRAGVQN